MIKRKKTKIIKRLYEEGRETTFVSAKKHTAPKKDLAGSRPLSKEQPRRTPVYKEGKPVPPLKKEALVTAQKEMPQPRLPFADTYELPSHYESTRVTLIVKDPFWIYAYWEIAPDALAAIKNNLSPEQRDAAKTVLRMYDVTMKDFNGYNANSYFDLEVGDYNTNWYVNIWRDNISYVGDIGLRIPDGRFFTLARSNNVTTPRSGYSPRTEQIWMKVTDETEEPLPYIVPQIRIERRDKISKELKSYIARKKRVFYIAEDEIRGYYSRLSPLLRDIISRRLSMFYGAKAQRYGFVLEGESDAERRKLLSRLPKEYFVKRMLVGASDVLFILGASEQLVKGGASDFVGERIKERKFFFELATELIVYGRTEPDAEVYLGSKKVNLQKDGTFNMRLSLPDGKIPLEFTAVSGDKKETKKINTYVERNTKHA